MTRYSSTPLSFTHLVKASFAAYPVLFKQLWPLFLLSGIVHLINPQFFKFHVTIGWVALIGFLLLTWYLFTVILYSGDRILSDKNVTYVDSFRYAKFRFLFVLGGNVLFLVITALMFLLAAAIISVVEYFNLTSVFFIIGVLCGIFVFTLLYFAIPLIVLDKVRVFSAFDQSLRLVWGNWWRTFFVILVALVLIAAIGAAGVVLTGENRMLLLTVFNFIYQLFAYPLIIGVTLVLLNDLKLRKQRLVV